MSKDVDWVLLLSVVNPAVHIVTAGVLTTDQLHTILCVGTITQTDISHKEDHSLSHWQAQGNPHMHLTKYYFGVVHVDNRNAYSILVGGPDRQRPVGRPGHRREEISMALKATE
jgi:hypothetical protein